MPEGDTVWQTARRLHDALAGAALTHADLRVPRHATADLRGREVREVVARGKHLLIRIEPDLTVHSHLGMDGAWRVRPAGGRVPGAMAAQVRAVLATERALAVGSDLARLDLVRTTDEETLVGHLGPDLMGTDWDPAEAVRRLAASPDRPVAEAILDQRNLAGIGNVYAAELLFLRGAHPSAPVGEAGELDRLVRLARQMLWANRNRTGHVTTGEPCLRCGTLIARGEAAGRITFWCPHCQPPRS